MAKIIYTLTDEAPLLATSVPPGHRGLRGEAGVAVETRDISLAGRIIAAFADLLPEDQRDGGRPRRARRSGDHARGQHHQAAEHLRVRPQLKAAVAELQAQGYPAPDYPENRHRRGEGHQGALRQGQGQRGESRAARRQLRPPGPGRGQELRPSHPHSMGAWSSDSKTSVATMGHDDFRSNEQSVISRRRTC